MAPDSGKPRPHSEGPPPTAAPSAGGGPSPPAAGPAPALPADTDLDLLQEYATECREHIEAAETALLALESDPDDRESVHTVFRAFHTIKGTSGFLGLDWIRDLAHLAENLLVRARDGEIRLTGGHADLALEACDTLRLLIHDLQSLAPGQAVELPAGYAALVADLRRPQNEAHAVSAKVSVPRVGDLLVATGRATREQVEQAIASRRDSPIGEALIRSGAASAADVARALRMQRRMGRGLRDESVRVSTERLDRLVGLVGELVIAQAQVAADPLVSHREHEALARRIASAGRLVRELQDLTMGLRMVPLRGTFQRMERLTRDLARRFQVPVQLLVEGADTEIDRRMVEGLNDPLVHMIRNAVDHGIEPGPERLRAGKPEAGTLRLAAYHAGDTVVIELSDDGRGLDAARIRASAAARGLISPGAALSEAETLALIFEPGLSTAPRVTEISGRGVGMDVVRRGIEALRGRIEVASRRGQGTRFTLRLPLTLALSDAMVLRVGDERFLLPAAHVERSFPAAGADYARLAPAGLAVRHQDAWLPVLSLDERFGGHPPEETRGILVAARAHRSRAALLVDEVLGQQQIVIRSLGRSLGEIPGICGAAILGDGRVGLVLDLHGLLSPARSGASAGAAEGGPARAAA